MADSLQVRRLHSTYLVPRDHPAPEALRAELDVVAQRHVAEACAAAFASLLDPRDPSVWVIDRVAVEILMDVGARSEQEIGAFWGGKLAESVMRTIAAGENGEHVLHFASRAEYLAYFLNDLAAGRAWDRWHYVEFDGLRSLPAGSAIRQALVREPEHAERALLDLRRTGRLGPVLRRLSLTEARIVLDVLGEFAASTRWPAFVAGLDAWLRVQESGPAHALRLFIEVREADDTFSPSEVRTAVECVLAAARWTAQSGLRVATLLVGGHFSRALAAIGSEDYQALLMLRSLLEGEPQRLEQIQRLHESVAQIAPAMDCDLAGLLMLLPSMIEMPELPAEFYRESGAYLRFVLLLKCAGKAGRLSWRDSSLALASGIEGLPTEEGIRGISFGESFLAGPEFPIGQDNLDYFALPGFGIDPRVDQALSRLASVLMRRFARSLPGLGASSPGYLWKNVLQGPGRVRRRLLEPESGEIDVELASRPLAIVLRMAGLHDLKIALPWRVEWSVGLRFWED
jgi:hypothetical protein